MPCAGFKAAVVAPLVVVAGVLVTPALLESNTTGAVNVVGAVVVVVVALRSPELWQEANTNVISAMLKHLFMIIKLVY
jgi:hypothetical protein